MNTMINLVATRSKDGDHTALMRWYSDHVHILMGFPALRRAALYRSSEHAASAAPQYVCLYEFPCQAAFLAFEDSDARAKAHHIVESGWARNGIEITQRTQYLRLGKRIGRTGMPTGGTGFHLQSMALGGGAHSDVARWLSDRVHVALADSEFNSVAWHRACDASDAGGDALVLLEASHAEAASAALWRGAWELPAGADEHFGQAPSAVAVRWQAVYWRMACWNR